MLSCTVGEGNLCDTSCKALLEPGLGFFPVAPVGLFDFRFQIFFPIMIGRLGIVHSWKQSGDIDFIEKYSIRVVNLGASHMVKYWMGSTK